MIVKNEAHVIERCLRSVLPFIDSWVIADTGSSDGTQSIIQRTLGTLPGMLLERPWKDFAHNRNESLALARTLASYSLIIDADDNLQLTDGFSLPELTADGYSFDILHGSVRYRRAHLVKNALSWHWEGVLHEYLTCDDPHLVEHLPGLAIRYNGDGARSKDPEKFRRDARLLEETLQKDNINDALRTRYLFYLAQSYRDGGDRPAALKYYLERAECTGWVEETYISLLAAGRLQFELKRPLEETLASFARASALLPERLEARHGAALVLRLAKRYQEAFDIAASGLGRTAPPQGLFVESSIYEYGLRDEYAVSGYWAGHYVESLDACLTLLACETAPASDRKRFLSNARFAFDKLHPSPTSLPSPPVSLTAPPSIPDATIRTIDPMTAPAVNWQELDQAALAAYGAGAYASAFDAWTRLLDHPGTPPGELARLERNRDYAVPYLKDQYLEYPAALIERLGTRTRTGEPKVTLSITTCRRLDLFKATVCSFLNTCTDIDRIDRFLCIDDHSSADDRAEMQALFPFFEFVWKTGAERGHAHSLNLIREQVQTPWLLHLEDDWHFFARRAYVTECLALLESDPRLGQVLFNRNYAETLEDRDFAGGIREYLPPNMVPFVRHQYFPADSDAYQRFVREYPGRLNNAYWPHYSLRPSVLRTEIFKTVGEYAITGHFELDYARRFTAAGYRSVFLNGIYSLHTGRLTRERDDASRQNAYTLNEQPYPAV